MIYSCAQVCKMFNIPHQILYLTFKSGRIPTPKRVGGRYVYDEQFVETLREWMRTKPRSGKADEVSALGK